uniref:zinc-finger homeodomain protein 11-like n=1 Tax=Erigeron canadensis TaxID=72917 RepID=UPI001CB8F683|nr:zinc-finger homeodomain protein 11-like [Erigeron canadensis]
MYQKHNTITTADSPDTDGETPLHSQLIKPLSKFPNHHQPSLVAYKECLKNHAATIGSHALDGCGEFMQSPTSDPKQPTSLKCAACGCHRNFHRREATTKPNFIDYSYACAPHVLLSLADHHQNHMVAATSPGTPAAFKVENPIGRNKRFRTKFSQEQKDKMCRFAENMGWKMQRCDDKKVEVFCNEIGIRRGIFKVWMHNNKNTFGKKLDNDDHTISPTTAVAGDVDRVVVSSECDHDEKDDVRNNVDHHHGILCDNSTNSSDEENGGGGFGHLQASTYNGSSSSC